MKKTYINPEIEIVRIETSQMLAVSGEFGEGGKPGSGAASRGDYWDEDDE